jgi:hypothetical protein
MMATYLFRCDECGADLERNEGGDTAWPCRTVFICHITGGDIDVPCWGTLKRVWAVTPLRTWAKGAH